MRRRRRGGGGRVEIVADGFAPGIGAEGVELFVLGEVQGLDEGLTEIQRRKAGPFRQGRNLRSLPRDCTGALAAVALAGLKTRHYNLRRRGRDGRGFSLESGGKTAALQSAALAAIGKGERTQRGTVLGAIGGHGSLGKKELGFFGSLAEARRTIERK